MSKEKPKVLREQFAALKHLPRFFRLIWSVNAYMATANVLLRLLKSAVPLATLYVGKEIIDAVIRLINGETTDTTYLWTMVAVELGLAVLSDLMNRGITLLDSLLGDLFANKTSVELIAHAARLDLYQFEDAEFYDKMERARRQTTGRTVLMSQVLTQMQDMVTVLFLAGGLVAFNAWLLVAAGFGCNSFVFGRDPLQPAHLLSDPQLDTRAPRARLPALYRRQRPHRQGGQDIQPFRFHHGALPGVVPQLLPGQPQYCRQAGRLGELSCPP